MKRRNADCGKLRRPMKRNKITEGMYGSTTVLYMKFLVLWAIVITADFMFMFRFEFLWPFWLLLRSVHDSFKYKGLAFSVLFVCIAITSDLVCLFFIPVHWLLFAASTYVWVQYVWHTDKGICLPTIILWMLFVYLEAGIRWKDSRHMPHLDLCRPFAAHCIGYPVVTLGFGFKSYVGYRMRQRKQREVAKENEFYMQLLQQALPQEESPEEPSSQSVVISSNASSVNATAHNSATTTTTTTSSSHTTASLASVTLSSVIAAVSSSCSATLNGSAGGAQSAQNHHNHHHVNSNDHHNNSSSHSTGSISTSGGSTALGDDKSYVQLGSGNNSTSLTNHNHQHHHHQSPNSSSNNSSTQNNHTHQHHNNHSSNTKHAQINSTANGHVAAGSNSKSNRRSIDKENKNRSSTAGDNDNSTTNNISSSAGKHKHNNNNNNYQQLQTDSSNSNGNKDKHDAESSNYQVNHQQSHKEKQDAGNSKKHNSSIGASSSANGNVLQYETDEVIAVEPVEKTKGRRNRFKKDNASKDNHHHHHHSNHLHNNNSNHNSNNNNNSSKQQKDALHSVVSLANHNSDASSVSSSTSSTSSSSSAVGLATTVTNLANKVVSKICESCLKLEADVKKYRSELSHMKQIENELRQKLESNMTTKSCLQAKQKECDELEKRIQELTNARHADMLQLQTAERRLTEERRQKQSLDSLLNNEKKARKLAEEKASRPECNTHVCRQRKQQMDEEIKQLRRDLKLAEESKQQAEQMGCKWEQELRRFQAEIHNRESNQPGTEMLMNALAAIQDKNCTLEKNLSAETRVKLDLFSALGDAKRQLEIAENRRRSKEDEVLDLKAKIAQLLAVMPTDSLCLTSCNSSGGSSMLRMNDTPPLGSAGPGPSSPMLNSLNAAQQQQQQQQQHVGMVPVSMAASVLGSAVSSAASNLDPNASVYTPKTGPGGEA